MTFDFGFVRIDRKHGVALLLEGAQRFVAVLPPVRRRPDHRYGLGHVPIVARRSGRPGARARTARSLPVSELIDSGENGAYTADCRAAPHDIPISSSRAHVALSAINDTQAHVAERSPPSLEGPIHHLIENASFLMPPTTKRTSAKQAADAAARQSSTEAVVEPAEL